MSMAWDYVSELRPPTGLSFVPQVIYEYGQPRWNYIGRELLICQPELSGNPTSSHPVANQGNLATKIMNPALQSIFVHI
jgi:hypothetical protein